MSDYHRFNSTRFINCRDIIGKKFRAIKNITLISARNRTIVRKDKIIFIKGIQISKLKWWEKYLCCRKPKVSKVTVRITSNANSHFTFGFGNKKDDKILFYIPKESDPIFKFVTKGGETKVAPNTQYIL